MQLYVHIPFCRQKCRYCAFVSFAGQEAQKEKYVELLLKEAGNRKNEFTEEIRTMFIGGGTPSLLTPEQLAHLTAGLFAKLPAEQLNEFTIEANPGTVTDQWMSAAVKAGMNRLSLGMQAFQPELLAVLGRIHQYHEVADSVKLARAYGIENINIDLIFGIPGQTLEQWKETLKAALALDPVHISAYGLIPEENTPMNEDLESGALTLPDPDLEREMYDTAISELTRHGMRQYEVSNFARPGFECRHNIGYWKQVPYAGLGISAASMEVLQRGNEGMICRRRTNPGDFTAYEQMVNSSGKPAEETLVLPAESRFETLMLGLRMNDGVDENEFEKRHGTPLDMIYGEKLRKFESQGLMIHSGHAWKLTRRGFDIQNSILVEFMED